MLDALRGLGGRFRRALRRILGKAAKEAGVGLPGGGSLAPDDILIARFLDEQAAALDVSQHVRRVLLNTSPNQASLESALAGVAGVTAGRAKFRARNFLTTAFGKLAQAKQEAAGNTRYVWTTAQDERVRPDHADLDGQTFLWSQPPVINKTTGRVGHPGDDYNCRCRATPVDDSGLVVLDQ